MICNTYTPAATYASVAAALDQGKLFLANTLLETANDRLVLSYYEYYALRCRIDDAMAFRDAQVARDPAY